MTTKKVTKKISVEDLLDIQRSRYYSDYQIQNLIKILKSQFCNVVGFSTLKDKSITKN